MVSDDENRAYWDPSFLLEAHLEQNMILIVKAEICLEPLVPSDLI
jgi:hypothetical protein